MRLVDEYQAATTRDYINWDPSSMGGVSAKVSSSSCRVFHLLLGNRRESESERETE